MAIDDDSELRILRAAVAEQEATIQRLELSLAEAEGKRQAVRRRLGGLSAVQDVVEALDRERRVVNEQWLQRELAAASDRTERTLDHLRRELAYAKSEREIITGSEVCGRSSTTTGSSASPTMRRRARMCGRCFRRSPARTAA